MKKMFVLIACLIVASGVFAQEKVFSYGIKAGLNLSTISGKDVDGAKMKANFYAGVVTEFRLSTLFAVSPELLYSGQGATYKGEGEKAHLNLSYLNLPVLAKFYVTKGLSLNVGPQIGYALSAKMKVGSESEKLNKDDYNHFDFSAAVGATYNFGKFFAEARYTLGLTDIVKETKNKNNVIQVGVGYKF